LVFLHLQRLEIAGDIREILFDEIWHFAQQKKPRKGSTKPRVTLHAEVLPKFRQL
jgi:hypothetical protein